MHQSVLELNIQHHLVAAEVIDFKDLHFSCVKRSNITEKPDYLSFYTDVDL